MATKYCTEHGSVEGTATRCPQCSKKLKNVFEGLGGESVAKKKRIICTDCDTKVGKKTKFCPNCGSKIKNQLKKTGARVETFKGCDEIIISEMLATVEILSTKAKIITITITGDEEKKQKASIQRSGNTVMVKAPLPMSGNSRRQHGYRNQNISINFGSSTGMINGQLIINGVPVDMDREIKVLVEVPFGTTIKIGKLVGTCRIGDVKGDLITNIQGVTTVIARSILSLDASISGSGKVSVNRIYGGRINARVSGSGDINIQDGNASAFHAAVSGSGDVSFRGVAETADMAVTGSGDIYLGECKSVSLKRESGSGDIRVGREPQSSGGKGFSDW